MTYYYYMNSCNADLYIVVDFLQRCRVVTPDPPFDLLEFPWWPKKSRRDAKRMDFCGILLQNLITAGYHRNHCLNNKAIRISLSGTIMIRPSLSNILLLLLIFGWQQEHGFASKTVRGLKKSASSLKSDPLVVDFEMVRLFVCTALVCPWNTVTNCLMTSYHPNL